MHKDATPGIARALLGAPGHTTRSKDATSNKGIATSVPASLSLYSDCKNVLSPRYSAQTAVFAAFPELVATRGASREGTGANMAWEALETALFRPLLLRAKPIPRSTTRTKQEVAGYIYIYFLYLQYNFLCYGLEFEEP